MNNPNTARIAVDLVSSAAAALKSRAEEVNRLNVFPVPDGDTGTNMSLTMDSVLRELSELPAAGSIADACHAVTHGSLMGARGNSGVILSQILRGMCEGVADAESIDAELIAAALERAVVVSFQAVRKPVEGTMLTVIRDVATAASEAAASGHDLDAALEHASAAAFESVRRTPELLPVLKENGVVDAGGFGLAILIEGFVSAALGREVEVGDVASSAAPLLHVEPVDDWDDDEFLYCTEFLLFGENIDREAVGDYIASAGGSELVVGASGEYKIHVHTNDPGAVLSHVTAFGEVAEVHVNNMRRQQATRDEMLRAEEDSQTPSKPMGFVAVASGEGFKRILTSLGVDRVVSGGQTMNPSTEDLLEAIEGVRADAVVVFPNNKNIVMASNAAASVASKPVAVVPTTSVPASFSALLAYDGSDDPTAVAETMSEAAAAVRTGEITFAVKDARSEVGPITAGQVIAIVDDKEIEVIGEDVDDVAIRLTALLAEDAETLSLYAGIDYDDASLEALTERISAAYPDIEVESYRGEQPLYPLIISAE